MLLIVSKTKKIKSRPKSTKNTQESALVSIAQAMAEQDPKTKKEALNRLLTQSLAAYVVLNSKEPMCDVMKELFSLEYQAGQIATAYFNDDRQFNLRGALASVYSVIPIGRSLKSVKQIMHERKAPKTLRRSKSKKPSRATRSKQVE